MHGGDRPSPDGDFDLAGSARAEHDFAVSPPSAPVQTTPSAAGPWTKRFGYQRVRRQHEVADISLGWVYLHRIEEHARHNRHADLLRERIDGVTGQ